ncbi:MAG: hypothetical protein GY778_29260 [bacterium]|nr:hypothetical protein [bacterium]
MTTPAADPDSALMDYANQPSRYKDLVRQCRPKKTPKKTVEQQLDAILDLHQQRQAQAEKPDVDPKQAAIDAFRHRMRDELIPEFEFLKKKYEPSRIAMALDASDLLDGGVKLVIEMTYEAYGMSMEGTVTLEGVAFHEARYSNKVRGVLTTGPMLRTRGLTLEGFREFLCDRISQLVRSAMRVAQR